MKTTIILTILTIVFGSSIQQQEKSVADLINEIYKDCMVIMKNPVFENKSTNTSDGCVCVPFYQCKKDFTINTDGAELIDIRIDENSATLCANPQDVCCTLPNTTSQVKSIPVKNGCGYRYEDGIGLRTVDDNDYISEFGEFPWMIAIFRKDRGDPDETFNYHCGGTLIHPKAVITSAHCVKNRKKIYKVRAGDWNIEATDEMFPHQDRTVKSRIIHPEYYSGGLFNDIAILLLEEPFQLGENVGVACLPKQSEVISDGTRCLASGWGKDKSENRGRQNERDRHQAILKKIELPTVERSKCQTTLRKTRKGPDFKLHKSFICAGGEAGKDTCYGDGGSPLVCPIPAMKGRYQLGGIVSWSIGCGDGNIPGVYANVGLFRNWIDEEMKKQGVDPIVYTY